jgi:hypothetical protein
MTILAHSATHFADVSHHRVTTAVQVFLFWIVAAVLAAACHMQLDARWPFGGAVPTIAAILSAAYAYTRFCARHAGTSHALGVGMAWLVLAMAAEMTVSRRLGHGWYAVIGTPGRPLLRNVVLFVWVFAPALFAQREIDTASTSQTLRNR